MKMTNNRRVALRSLSVETRQILAKDVSECDGAGMMTQRIASQ